MKWSNNQSAVGKHVKTSLLLILQLKTSDIDRPGMLEERCGPRGLSLPHFLDPSIRKYLQIHTTHSLTLAWLQLPEGMTGNEWNLLKVFTAAANKQSLINTDWNDQWGSQQTLLLTWRKIYQKIHSMIYWRWLEVSLILTA